MTDWLKSSYGVYCATIISPFIYGKYFRFPISVRDQYTYSQGRKTELVEIS